MLAYAVLLLTGAALGDRFGRKRMFLAGSRCSRAASACAALAPTTGLLVAARAVQGAGAAIVTPLTLTLLAEAFRAERRGMAIGVWSGISGIAVAIGPLVGGAVVQAISWHWIFWINVPIGLVAGPAGDALAAARAAAPTARSTCRAWRSRRPARSGSCSGSCARSRWAGPARRCSRRLIAGRGAAGRVRRATSGARAEPMLPMAFFAKRSFAVTNVVSLSMYFGMFGSIFFLSQYLQNVLHNTPLQAGLKLLVWTGATMVVAPLAGVFSERLGSRPFMVAGPGAAGGRARLARDACAATHRATPA